VRRVVNALESSPPDSRPWLRRRATLVAAVAVSLALGADAGYQVYAARVSHRNAVAVVKVNRLTKAQCSTTRLFYDLFNALVADTTPHFGSPPDGPPTPGARSRLIARLYVAERLAAAPLRAQGCKLDVP
jgi:hypothetical protein